MSTFVLVEERPTAGVRHTIIAGSTIGREDCDVTLADDEVSRRHAHIRALDGALAIEDLGSTNGTYVNGNRLTGPVALHNGDEVAVGEAALRVEVVGADDGATRAAAIPVTPATTARAMPDPVAPEPTRAPEPATPAGSATPPVDAGQARGDVPAPAPASESRVHQRLAPVATSPKADFQPETGSVGRRHGSAATRTEATVFAYAEVLAVAAAIVVYLATR